MRRRRVTTEQFKAGQTPCIPTPTGPCRQWARIDQLWADFADLDKVGRLDLASALAAGKVALVRPGLTARLYRMWIKCQEVQHGV